jgi:hypothetical protein
MNQALKKVSANNAASFCADLRNLRENKKAERAGLTVSNGYQTTASVKLLTLITDH